MRAELGPAELAQHTAKRAELVRQKAELSAKLANKSEPHRPNEGQVEFVEDTAKNTGKSKRTVERAKARGEKIEADILALIKGTVLDKGTYLDKLRPVPHSRPTALRAGGRGRLGVRGQRVGARRGGWRKIGTRIGTGRGITGRYRAG